MKDSIFDSLFIPKGVVFFESLKPGKTGYEILKSNKEAGFKGEVYPINPLGGEVLGYPVLRCLDELPGPAQPAVVHLPMAAVAQTVEQCGRKGIKAAVIISSGFSEVGNHEAEQELANVARRWEVRLVGPNCAGLINPWYHHFPSIEVRALSGHTAFITQSGALGGATLAWAEEKGFGFSKFISYGNRCNLGDHEFLQYFADDPQTRVVEGIEEMFELCQALSQCPFPRGNKVTIVTNSRGPGILAADKAEMVGLNVAEPSQGLQQRLRPHLSPYVSLKNPIDLTVELGEEEYPLALKEAISEYDAGIVINVATPYLDSNGIARGVIDAARKFQKPVLANFMEGRIVREAIHLFNEAGIANLSTGERCTSVLAKLVERKILLERIHYAPPWLKGRKRRGVTFWNQKPWLS